MKSLLLALSFSVSACASPVYPLVQIDNSRVVEAKRVYPDGPGFVIVEIQATSGNWLKTRWAEDRIKLIKE